MTVARPLANNPRKLTAQDAIEYGNKFLEGHSVSASQESLRWAIHNAYQELGQSFDWSFLHKQGRIAMVTAQTAGTATYDHTGGANERQVTLAGTGATFSASNEGYSIRLDDVPCLIESIKSTTVATLDSTLNPGRDVAAGSSYRLYPRCYNLPNDFQCMVTPWTESIGWDLTEVSYDELLRLDRHYDESGTPQWFCIRAVEDLLGQMGLYIHPSSDDDLTLDFIYRKRAREVRYTGHQPADYQGTIAVTSGSANVTGTSTAFSTLMVGSVFRIASSTRRPTGLRGDTPYMEQRSIVAVTDATHLTLDDEVETTRTGVSYTVADPIDIDPSLHLLFLTCTCKHLAYDRQFKDVPVIEKRYQEALQLAKYADNRSEQRSVAGFGHAPGQRRLHDVSPYLGEVG